MNENVPPDGGNGNSALTPTAIEGEARIRDLDLAARLGFERPNKIRELIERWMEALLKMGRCPTVGYRPAQGGKEANAYYLNRKQAIFITAKSETAEATEITIEIIERFDAYEKGVVALPDLSDPLVLQTLLVEHVGKRIEAERRAVVAEQIAEAATETIAAFDRIANADGSLSITEAAKALQCERIKDLTTWLHTNRWIYRRAGNKNWLGHQDKLRAGLLEHKITTVQDRVNGGEKVVEQVRITPPGLARIAKLLNPSVLRTPPTMGDSVHQPGNA